MSERDALDIIYPLMLPEVHDILIVERRWSPDKYEEGLTGALQAVLLPPVHG